MCFWAAIAPSFSDCWSCFLYLVFDVNLCFSVTKLDTQVEERQWKRKTEYKVYRFALLAQKHEWTTIFLLPICEPRRLSTVDHHPKQHIQAENTFHPSHLYKVLRHVSICCIGFCYKPIIECSSGGSFKLHSWVSSRGSDPSFQTFLNFWSQDAFILKNYWGPQRAFAQVGYAYQNLLLEINSEKNLQHKNTQVHVPLAIIVIVSGTLWKIPLYALR